jgi:hypothetical protein
MPPMLLMLFMLRRPRRLRMWFRVSRRLREMRDLRLGRTRGRRFVLRSRFRSCLEPWLATWFIGRMRCRLIRCVRLRVPVRLRFRVRLRFSRPLRHVLLLGPRSMFRCVTTGVIGERPRGFALRCQLRMRLYPLRCLRAMPLFSRHVRPRVLSGRAFRRNRVTCVSTHKSTPLQRSRHIAVHRTRQCSRNGGAHDWLTRPSARPPLLAHRCASVSRYAAGTAGARCNDLPLRRLRRHAIRCLSARKVQRCALAILLASKNARAGAAAKLANNHAAAERAPSIPPGLSNPAAFATSPATAAPIAMP